MFASNPFAALTAVMSADVMQAYIVLMIIFVAGGTLLDVVHKKSARYFFENATRAQRSAKRTLSSGEKTSFAIQTLTSEVLTSSEFANPKRRMSHLMTMYGFIAFVVSTVVLIFKYPGAADAGIWSTLWHLGALSLALGGYWFWFFIRVDVNSEGVRWYQLKRADLFIVSLLAMSTLGLIWSATGSMLFFVLFITATTVLFTTVLWSKFAHMFFKPAAAFQKRCIMADGSRENLPADYDLSDPKVHAMFPDIPTYMGKNPPNMGLGIKREAPNHY